MSNSESGVILKHSRIYALAAILNRGAAFFMIPIYTNYLRQEEYGIFGVIAVTSEVVGAAVGLRLGTAMSRLYFDYKDENDRAEVVTSAIIGSLAIFFCVMIPLWILAEPLARAVLGEPGLGGLLTLGIAGFLLNTLFTFGLQYFLIRQRSTVFLVAGTARSIVYITVTAILVVWLDLGVKGALVGILVANGLSAAGLLGPIFLRLGARFSRRKFADTVKFGLPLVPGQVAEIAGSFAERYLIVHLASLAASGVYFLGLRLAMVVNVAIVGPFSRIYLVRRFEAFGEGSEDREAPRVFTYFFLVVTFGGLAIATAAREIVGLVAPPDYFLAKTILPVMCLTQIIVSLLVITELGIYYAKIPRHLTASNLVMLAAQIALNLLLIPPLGILGAALAGAVAAALKVAVIVYLSRGLEGPRPEWGTLAAILGAAVFWVGMGYVIGSAAGWIGTAGKGLFTLLYPVAMLGSPLFSPEERRGFVRFLQSHWDNLRGGKPAGGAGTD